MSVVFKSRTVSATENVCADKEMVLVYLAADKAKSHEAQTLWSQIAKKYNGLGITSVSGAYAVFSLSSDDLFTRLHECVLSILC